MVSTSSLFMRLPYCLGGCPLSPAYQSLCKTRLFRGVHGRAPYRATLACLVTMLDPRQPVLKAPQMAQPAELLPVSEAPAPLVQRQR
jgi:hypothetical protein